MKGKSSSVKKVLAIAMALVMTITAGVFVFADPGDESIRCYDSSNRYVTLNFNPDTHAYTGVYNYGSFADYYYLSIDNVHQYCNANGIATVYYKTENDSDADTYSTTVTLPRLAHTDGAWVVDGAVADDGSFTIKRICANCGETLYTKDATTPAHTHSGSDEYLTIYPATCTEPGRQGKYCTICEAFYDLKDIAANGHVNTYTVTYPATCAEEGEIVTYCSDCGAVTDSEVIQKSTTHTYGAWEVIYEPTENQPGLMQRTCVVCGKVDETSQTIPATPHTCVPGPTQIIYPATCTRAGLKATACAICGQTMSETVIPVANHIEGPLVTAIEPTCTTAGEKHQYCVDCGALIAVESINALTHTEFETTIPATCAEPGAKITRCSRCGVVTATAVINKTEDHVYGPWEVVLEPTLTQTGLAQRTCVVCGKVDEENEIEIPYHDHVWGPTEVILPATCTRDGLKARTCTICGAADPNFEETIGALDHVDNDIWVTVKDPTCTTAGEQHKYCADCGAVIGVRAIDPIDHDNAYVITYPATCAKEGVELTYCPDCGKVIGSNTIDKTEAHVPGPWEVVYEPSLTQDGLMQQTCVVCGKVLDTQPIAKHEHIYGPTQVIYEATCTHDGLKARVCTICGMADPDCQETIKAYGHDEGAFVVTKAPTCTESGEKVKYCTVCGAAVVSEEIEPLGHTGDGNIFTIIEPTCHDAGLQGKFCTRCHHFYETEEVDALGHVSTTPADCLHDEVCDRCGIIINYKDAKAHQFSEWATYKPATFCKDEVQKRTCKICGLNEYRIMEYTSGVHNKCCLHKKDGSCCIACKILHSFQAAYFTIVHGAHAVVGGNIVAKILYPDLWNWSFSDIFNWPFLKFDK